MRRLFRDLFPKVPFLSTVFRCVVFLFTAGFLASCSGSAPSLYEWKWRILYRDDGEHRYEELYGFFRASDPDGAADLASLSVTVNSLDLEWNFERSEWTQAPNEEDLWGVPPMISHTGMRLPDGLYTVRLSDLAGRSDEMTFRPLSDRPDPQEIDWPKVSLEEENGVLSISGPFTGGELILRGDNREFLSRTNVIDGAVPNFSGAFWWELWFGYGASSDADADTPRGFRIGPFLVDSELSEKQPRIESDSRRENSRSEQMKDVDSEIDESSTKENLRDSSFGMFKDSTDSENPEN